METPDRDHRVVLHSAEPGTPSHDALCRLKVAGAEEFPASLPDE